MKQKFLITATLVLTIGFVGLAGCSNTETSSDYPTIYEPTVADLESKVSCLEDAIDDALSSLSDAQYDLSSIEDEFYWINETQAEYPEDHDELDDLVEDADEAFVAIDNAGQHIDDLEWSLSNIEYLGRHC